MENHQDLNELREDKKQLFSGVRGTSVKILNRVERTDSYLDKLPPKQNCGPGNSTISTKHC